VDASTSASLVVNGNNYVFVTSTITSGNIGGTAGGDQMCSEAAADAGLPGTYRAWLSTPASNVRDRLGAARGWIRVDGAPVFDSLAAMASEEMFFPLNLDENGQATTYHVWTGSNDDGTYSGWGACQSWTSADPSLWDVGGSGSLQSAGWSDGTNVTACDVQTTALDCFGIDLNAPLVFTKTSGRVAFVTRTSWDPSTGIPQADALCALEAIAANLPGTFLALLATPTASAISRFDLSQANWVRPDGIPVALSPSALASGMMTAAIDVYSDGTYSTDHPNVWTGATSPAAIGSPQTTCNNWTESDGGVGNYGRENSASGQSFYNGYDVPCTTQAPVYCLQQ
jgi:hypothetical protein